MHEFQLENREVPHKGNWILCRVFLNDKDASSNSLSPQNFIDDSSAGLTSPDLVASSNNEYALLASSSHGPFPQGQNPTTSLNFSEHDGSHIPWSDEEDMIDQLISSSQMVQAKYKDDYGIVVDKSLK
ncbi:protein CUP-SHAPED COTYLEDON 3-like [Forsythia ovata]|uniref:Protein CUP-SHAPED COTYLEDON 3-like n=1 Tax=Forsythia ovata TaxID=205694 RepID=A0ABD1X7G8_9LAMI